MEQAWGQLLDTWPYSEQALFSVGTTMCTVVAFWGLNIVLWACYHFGWFDRYKIQDATWPPRELVVDGVVKNILGLLMQPFAFYYLLWGTMDQGVGSHWFSRSLPPWLTYVVQVAVYFLISDFCFYWMHRACHIPVLYKHIHKKHHLYKASIGLAANYAHPFEEIVVNFGSVAIPFYLWKPAHITVFWAWLLFRYWESVDGHCGYNFPWSPWIYIRGPCDFHDWHHSHNIGCFGIFPWSWDRVLGTDGHYREHMAKNKKKSKSR